MYDSWLLRVPLDALSRGLTLGSMTLSTLPKITALTLGGAVMSTNPVTSTSRVWGFAKSTSFPARYCSSRPGSD